VTVAALMLLGGLNLAPGADKVLVPGDPPLTQEVVNLYQEMWEWYCDVKLTPEQRKQHTQHFITVWRKKGSADTTALLAGYRRMEKEWRDILALKGTEQDRKRAEVSARWMTILRNAADDPPGRFLVSVYDAAYKPGGTKNPILVPGDPPLGKLTIDQGILYTEWLLDAPLTDDQRREYQRLYLLLWKQWDKPQKGVEIETNAKSADLLEKASPYDRHFWRSTHWEYNPRTGRHDWVPGR
jgi:hypothetical protein